MIQTDYEKRSGSEIQCEVNELDNIKVGNRIVYNGKNCTICKILVRNGSSRFLVRYDNEVLDYVPNDKSRYRIASSHIPSHNMAPENTRDVLFKNAVSYFKA